MKGDKLTPKQEAFVQALFAGKSQREAYINVYERGGKSDKTINEAACKLANATKIYTRLQTLRDAVTQQIVKKEVWTKEIAINNLLMVLSRAQRIVSNPDSNEAYARDWALCVKSVVHELNEMHGFHEAKKVEAKVNSYAETLRQLKIGDRY
jgi:hypothetical protein